MLCCFSPRFRSRANKRTPQAEGLQALDHHDYQHAEQIFTKVAASDPKDYSALFNLALAETALNENDQAAEHYKQTLALKPNLYEAELNLGILYLRERRAVNAEPLLRDATKQKPNQARPLRYLGDSLLAKEDLNGADEAYRQALAIDPRLAAAHLGLGQSLAREGKLDDAYRITSRQPISTRTFNSYLLELAVAFSKANRPDDAIPLLKDFPNDAGAREELGRLYLRIESPRGCCFRIPGRRVDCPPRPQTSLRSPRPISRTISPIWPHRYCEEALAANPNDYRLAYGGGAHSSRQARLRPSGKRVCRGGEA